MALYKLKLQGLISPPPLIESAGFGMACFAVKSTKQQHKNKQICLRLVSVVFLDRKSTSSRPAGPALALLSIQYD